MRTLIQGMFFVLALLGATSVARAQGVFFDNTGIPQFGSGAGLTDDRIADDVQFTGSQTVTGFSIVYHADSPVNAVFTFSAIDPRAELGATVGAAVATFTASSLPAGDHVFRMQLAPGQQFTWTASVPPPPVAGVTRVFGGTSGGFFSVQFTSSSGGPTGNLAGWYGATGSSPTGYFDMTTGQVFTFTGDDPVPSHYMQLESTAVSATASQISAVRAMPSSLVGGQTTHGLVTLDQVAPAGGATITLAGSAGLVSVPATVLVPGGQTTAEFDATTSTVAAPALAFISATAAFGFIRTAQIGLSPARPADQVSISQAEYRTSQQQLRVSAHSSDSTATLTVFVAGTNVRIGALTSDQRGGFSGRLSFATNPGSIAVRSSSGGSATAAVTTR